MMHLPRFVRKMTLMCAVSGVALVPVFAFGQADDAPKTEAPSTDAPKTDAPKTDAPAPDAPASDLPKADPPKIDAGGGGANAQPSAKLLEAVGDFWHYAKIGKYDIATQSAQAILSGGDKPDDVLAAFRQVSASRKDDLSTRMLDWRNKVENQEFTAAVGQLTEVLQNASGARKTGRDFAEFVDENIKRLTVNERAFDLAVQNLRQAGERAAPQMIDYLRDPDKREYHYSVQRALERMGRGVLNPLLVTTQMKDNRALIAVINVLTQKGYADVSKPYLAKLATAKDTPADVKGAAIQALLRMNEVDPTKANPAQLFAELAERFYYGNVSIVPGPKETTAYVWYWDEGKGLTKRDVPAPIFNEIMAQRAAEESLRLDPGKGEMVSLWLAANYKREADLPEGGKDIRDTNGDYWGKVAGTRYLGPALARALKDRHSAVAYKAVKSIGQIVGEANLFANEDTAKAVLLAMESPDRLVRFEAAMAVAAALPQKSFENDQRVMPTLAEAVAQTGRPGALVVHPADEKLKNIVAGLGAYNVKGATTVDNALAQAGDMPAIDVVIISDDLNDGDVRRLLTNRSGRLDGVPKLIITKTTASRYAGISQGDKLIGTVQSEDPAQVATAAEATRKRAGVLSLDEKTATEYALRAADLISKVAINRSPVLDVQAARPVLLVALDDPRPEIVKAAGAAMGVINAKEGQAALLAKALDEKTADELKVPLYRDLARNAKLFGNQLEASATDNLRKVAESAANMEVRTAAAEAHGALNLPAEAVKDLILNQAKD